MNWLKLKKKLRKLKSYPIKVLLETLWEKLAEKMVDRYTKFTCLRRNTHLKDIHIKISSSYVDVKFLNLGGIDKATAKYLCDMYLNHSFELLGSGWVNVNYDVYAAGLEGYSYNMSPHTDCFDEGGEWLKRIILKPHIDFSKKIWGFFDKGYIPIDWQMDFKSGYRYSQKKWHKDQSIGKYPGVDIKVPWEISRMQHLPQMAIFSFCLPDYSERLIKEFKNQVLDFIMTNPPNMGVNWACTMDVGIRAANLLLAFDIFRQLDYTRILDEGFCSIFSNCIYEHGDFIIHNLEWNNGDNGNHYLGDISGLLFAAAYLERNSTTDSWLAFSIQELVDIFEKQFYEDGGNFENSTSYHRLTTEMMIYATALVYGVLKSERKNAFREYDYKKVKRLRPIGKQLFDIEGERFFPDWYLNKLFKAGCLTADIAKPNGNMPQIGDNDSGRFTRLSPSGEFLTVDEAVSKYENLGFYKCKNLKFHVHWDENMLDHSTLVSALGGLFENNRFKRHTAKFPLEKSMIESISHGIKYKKIYTCNEILLSRHMLPDLKNTKTSEIEFSKYTNREIDISELDFIAYPCFGLFIFKSDILYLSITAGSNGRAGQGVHMHEDRLSFELNLAGKDIFIDPGTYIYTPLPEKRNHFRSRFAHNAPIVKSDLHNRFIDLFSLEDNWKYSLVDYSKNYIKLVLFCEDAVITREFEILKDKLVIRDKCNKEITTNLYYNDKYSNGYGKLLNSFDCGES